MPITISNEQDQIRLRLGDLKATSKKILRILGLCQDISLSIVFVSTEDMKRLNRRYFGRRGLTDVIALGYKASTRSMKRKKGQWHAGYIGDIAICPEVARDNSRRYGRGIYSEIELYIVHGILHLLGYDDTTPGKLRDMREKEREIIERL